MRPGHFLLLAAFAAIVAACAEQLVAPSKTGSIGLRLISGKSSSGVCAAAQPSAAGHLNGARLVVSGGQIRDSIDLKPDATNSSFSGTIDGLAPGFYSVVVEGLVANDVDYFGQTSGVQVRAGQNATATISNFCSFRPVLNDLGSPTAATVFTASWSRVTNAESYKVEWDTRDTVVTDTFATLRVTATGTYNVLVRAANASVPAGRSSDSKSIRVAATSASRSLVVAAPATITASTGAITATITVTVKDANDIPLRGATVMLDATPPTGNTLIQSAETTNASGQMTGTLSSAKAEQKTISAHVNGNVTVTQTATVTVTPGPPAVLVFTAQPSDLPQGRNVFPAGYDIFPAVQVAAQDALGNTDSSYATPVALSFGSNPSGAVLTGATGPQTPMNGFVTWANLNIDKVATGYTLVASSGSLLPATSAPFNITIPGDLNLDGQVGYRDYDLLVAAFGATDRPPADIDKDGKVGIFDYNILVSHFTVPPPAWNQLAPIGSPPAARWLHSTVYDPNSKRMVLFAGQGASAQFYDLWVLTNPTNSNGGTPTPSWMTFSLLPTPGPRVGHSAVYDPTSDRMVIFGWADTVPWILSNATGLQGTPSWSPMSLGGPPLPSPNRAYHTAVYDPSSNQMIVFGGYGDTTLSDLWVLTNANGTGGTWRQLSPAGGPGPRLQHSAVYDPDSSRMIVFGGEDRLAPTAVFDDVWVLTNANGVRGTPAWIRLSPTGGPPTARRNHTAVYDSTLNRMIVFGGNNLSAGNLNDVWVLNHANGTGGTPTWCQLSPGGTPPAARTGHTAVYDPVSNSMVVFAGNGSNGLLNDVWVLADALGTPCPP